MSPEVFSCCLCPVFWQAPGMCCSIPPPAEHPWLRLQASAQSVLVPIPLPCFPFSCKDSYSLETPPAPWSSSSLGFSWDHPDRAQGSAVWDCSPGGNAQPSCPRGSGWFLSITATRGAQVSGRNVARDSEGVSQTPLCAGQEFQSPVGSQRLQHFRHPPQGSPLAQPSASFVCLHSRERCSSWRNHISACEKPQPRCC